MSKLNKYVPIIFLFVALPAFTFSCKKDPQQIIQQKTATSFNIRGADVSFAPLIENTIGFKNNNTYQPLIDILKDNGINTIRLRVWNNPQNIHSSIQQVVAFSKYIKAKGLKLWINFHYSDTWADPGNQTTPLLWQNANAQQLSDSVFAFTSYCLALLNKNNTPPDYVQIGNEIDNGFLWPQAKLYTSANGLQNFATILSSGLLAVKQIAPQAKTILHVANHNNSHYFFNLLAPYKLSFDIIGVSYYPWWHGKSLDSLENSMLRLEKTYNKPVLIAETAYPFTLEWNDYTNNIVGNSNQLIASFDATPNGQATFIAKLVHIATKNNRAHSGVCYWAPEWVAFNGKTAKDGSTWENLALFSFGNTALPALYSLGNSQ